MREAGGAAVPFVQCGVGDFCLQMTGETVPDRSFEPNALLEVTAHRPWPLPAAPWLMRQGWYDLLFAHWPVAPEGLRALVPETLPLDVREGTAWLGVVPFEVRGARARGLPGVPSATDFLELNVRTYVTVNEKPGVYFFSLDAASALAVLGARTFFRLRYYEAEMRREHDAGWTNYRSRRIDAPAADLVCSYRPVGPVLPPAEPGTLEHFLTERYCLYTATRSGRVLRADIHHPPWPLQPAEARFERLGAAEVLGVPFREAPPLLHYAAAQRVLIWPPQES